MSARKFYLKVAPRARVDIDNIFAYTLEQWGERQATIYREKINRALNGIAADPYKGRESENLRSALAEKHRIFYRVEKNNILILRILHQRMDSGRHLS